MRIDGWDTALTQELQAAANLPFEWGVHDCVSFPMAVIAKITGVDHMKTWRGTYKTAKGALGAIKRKTKGRGLEAVADEIFERLSTTLLAQRGDLVVTDLEFGATFGICAGRRCAFIGPNGLVFIPLARMRAAWRV